MIVMKSGIYGARDGLRTRKSGPFSLSPEEEQRLVSKGVAEFVQEEILHASPPPESDLESDAERLLSMDDLMAMPLSKLKAVASNMGLNVTGKTKQDYVAAIAEATMESGEEAPDLTAEDVIV